MDEIKMEREIKEMLHQCADELHAPDSMQARVKFALNNAPARKRHLWSKRFVAVAAVAAIAVTGAFAAGGMGGIFSQGWSDQRLASIRLATALMWIPPHGMVWVKRRKSPRWTQPTRRMARS